jgi:hypothetical protein
VDWLVHNGRRGLQRDPRKIVFGSVFEHDSFALLTTYRDGSGLVLVSDTLGPAFLYAAQLASLWLRPGDFGPSSARRVTTASRAALQWRSGSVEHHDQTRLAAVLLRYLFVNGRLLGAPRRLKLQLDDRHRRFPLLLSDLAMYFVLAHEVAHFVLGHDTLDGTMRRTQDLEFAADEMAYRVVCGLARGPRGVEALAQAIRCAFLQMEALESALLIRRSTTHPTPTARLEQLSSTTGNAELRVPSLVLAGFESAFRQARDVRSPIPEGWWDLPPNSSSVVIEREGRDRYTLARLFDRWQGRSDDEHLAALEDAHEKGIACLAPSVRQAREGSPIAALTGLGVPRSTASLICDRSSGLSFHLLVQELQGPKAFADGVDPTERLLLAISAALLLGTALA